MPGFDVTAYYKFREQAPNRPPANAELVAYEHLGFLIVRESSDYILFTIRNLDGSAPPLPLRALQFTKRSKAEGRIEAFIEEEKTKQVLK
jgi:hypothetical protein